MLVYAPQLAVLGWLATVVHALNVDNGAHVGVFASMLEKMQELHRGVSAETLAEEPEDDQGNPPIIGKVSGAKTVQWDEDSGVRFEVEAAIALAWITMVASLPLIVIKVEGKAITRTQLALFACMWVIFLGGCFLFTHVILFQSVHFERVRPLNVIEAVYLMAQIITTVGYGDITPAMPRGQICVAIYVIISILIIANVLSQVADNVVEEGKKYAANLRRKLQTELAEDAADMEQAEHTFSSKWASFTSNPTPESPDYKPLLASLAVYFSFALVGTLFFHFFPGEGKTVFQGIYMSVITLSTVGFGAFTPVTRGGLVFGAFWMTFGSLALVGVVGTFASFVNQMAIRERWSAEAVKKEQIEFYNAFPAKVSKADFLKMSLIHKKLVDETELAAIEQFYEELSPDDAGEVGKAALEEFMVQKGHMEIPKPAAS
jgi:hypothetical protein